MNEKAEEKDMVQDLLPRVKPFQCNVSTCTSTSELMQGNQRSAAIFERKGHTWNIREGYSLRAEHKLQRKVGRDMRVPSLKITSFFSLAIIVAVFHLHSSECIFLAAITTSWKMGC